ncbi:28S rRNA (cytosine-C(5))-methyltransferase [Amyelois transitella]|uniref:28S rRNA (cytosine-C(5))-methyltransferase n=1 Tax=Amyelois transitella TaxID=680683 RepID=UPI0029905CBB|nr:28S rRNA (cytosine-C(5))-methyltransferase [Amyelois transitella]
MFEHSVKVPRHYKVAANIFKKVSTEGGSVKSLLYDNKLKHFRTNVLYALITETIKHAADIDKIFENCSILEKETRLDPWLAKVLTAELLFGKKSLPGKSKPEQTILSYKDQFQTYTSDHQDDMKTEATRRPRYVRINTNLLTTSDAIRAFQDEGYRFIRCTSGSYDDYLQQIQGLTEYDFTQDYHVKTMFVFPPGTKLHEHELYLENKIILQDKATALAVHLLAPQTGSVVFDMCAAPGMKTTQLAAYMRNEGKIYASERNEKRYQTLCDFVERTGSKCVETMHKDSLEIKRGDLDDVEYILLDPSCSGSGMELCVHNYIEATRLAKLTSLQEKFLKHAMNAFPKAKRIVYSTCSLFPEENERVITNVVKTSRAKWRVQDVNELLKGKWNNFGSAMYGSMGTRCLYAKPETDLTTGFFLAVLDRDEKDLEKSMRHANNVNHVDDVQDGTIEENNTKKNKKKRKYEEITETADDLEKIDEECKENNNNAGKEDRDSNYSYLENSQEKENIKKKKKKNKHKHQEISDNNSDKVVKNKKNKIEKLNDDKVVEDGGGNENRDYNVSNVENSLESEIIKKKKKKRKQQESVDYFEENDVRNKKKKNEGINETIGNLNIINGEKERKRKKDFDNV